MTGHSGVRNSLQEMVNCEQKGGGCSPRSGEVFLKFKRTCGVHRVVGSDVARATSSLSEIRGSVFVPLIFGTTYVITTFVPHSAVLLVKSAFQKRFSRHCMLVIDTEI